MTSDVRSIIGERLSRDAIRLAKELAWQPSHCLEVIDKLCAQNLAVVGVELWDTEESQPKWLASSDYQCLSSSGWSGYVDCCAQNAKRFVNRFAEERGAIFNLMWIDEQEWGSIQELKKHDS